MRIRIKDDNENWLNWGNLVNLWIDNPSKWPTRVGDLKQQMRDHGVVAEVEGADDRRVIMDVYVGSDDPLHIVLPNAEMRKKKLEEEVKPGIYPLPLFYDICFAGAKRASLSDNEARDFAFRRIGEYTVNECC